MDLLIAMVAMVALGIWRITCTDGMKQDDKPIMQEDGTVVYPDSVIPVGSNLELLYEVDAYTFILKQLGLK
jgi:hypothetical protein